MKILEILSEGLSPVLFHYTNVSKMADIAKSDEFRLTPDIGTTAEVSQRKNPKNIYYMSTARHRAGGYHLQSSSGVLLTLDGRKMSHTVSGSPMDYWGPEAAQYRGREKQEAEDRVFSDKPVIGPASSYITAIDMIFDMDERAIRRYPDSMRNARQVAMYAKRHNIPIHFYSNMQDLIARNTAKSIKPPFVATKKPDTWYRGMRGVFDIWTDLLYKKTGDELSTRGRDRARYLSYRDGFYGNDIRSSLAADIHNARSSDNRQELDTFLAHLKKHNIYDLDSYIDFVSAKWNNILNKR